LVPTAIKTSRSLYRLEKGEVWLRNKNRNVSIEVEMAGTTARLDGTELNLSLGEGDVVEITVLEGDILASNTLGRVTASEGEQVTATPGTAPTKRILLAPEDAVQWTLVLPPVSALTGPVPANVQSALDSLMAGEASSAYDTLLALEAARPTDAAVARALALAALVADHPDTAADAASRAVAAEPERVESWLLAAYAARANFDLDAAITAAERARSLAPDELPVLVLLATLYFGSDRIEPAREIVDRAHDLAPENAEVRSLRGFLRLAANDTAGAKAAFEAAIGFDPSLADARLGRGIAYMRSGDAATALESVSEATLLQPRRSLYLSYWGKMLHQLGRHEEALAMLLRARQLDPNDPTPMFYRAVILRDLNRPGEAIESFNQAVSLNGNRAVFRSRFLLDQDLASRNVDLAELYGALGLTAWARNRALASIKQDYTNASAHLFYAGALPALGQQAFSFNSEQLLARLLQPANINTFNSFNNYTVLYEQPGTEGTVTVGAGNQNAIRGDFSLFGSVPTANLAYQAGVFYQDDDGWRDTNFERTRDIAAIAKWAPTQRDGVLLSASFSELDEGDLDFPRFEVDAPVRPDDRRDIKVKRFELGYHHHLGPGADFLAVATRLSDDLDLFQREILAEGVLGGVAFRVEDDASTDFDRDFDQVQLQFMNRIGDHQLIGGTLQLWGEDKNTTKAGQFLRVTGAGPEQRLPFPCRSGPCPDVFSGDGDLRYESYYVQDIWALTPTLTLELAAYYDRVEHPNPLGGTSRIVDDFNPRAGLIYKPDSANTFRFAAFRYILPVLSPRTDPTDVAGIPVFLNDEPGSKHKALGFAWEHGWGNGFAALNLEYRENRSERLTATGGQTVYEHLDGRRKGASLELNQLLSTRVALLGRYRYLDVRDERFPDLDRREHLLQAGLRYVRPDGFSAGLQQTFRALNMPERKDENLAITDLDLAYEFPDKAGKIRFAILNLLDEEFNWVTDRFTLDGRAPSREIRASVSINF
jgi:tetratricopeptide (TPR) repeat protein